MTGWRMSLSAVVATAGLLGSTGCFLRTETINIGRDGAVDFQVVFEGSAKDFETLDAIPAVDGPWAMTRTVLIEGGKEKLKLQGVRRFGPGEPLPAGFAESGISDADLALDFPTTLRVEDRRDGRYFTFHRRYAARPWAFIEHWRSVYFDDDVDALAGKPVTELTSDQRRKIIQAFASVEAVKQLEYARGALAEALPAVRVEDRLMARRALLAVYGKDSLLAGDPSVVELAAPAAAASTQGSGDRLDQLIARCDGREDSDKCYDREANRLFDEAYAAYVDALAASARLSPADVERFAQAYGRVERRHTITEELGGQQFQIIVTMPGTIMAHNADRIEKGEGERAGESSAIWKFDGTAFRDRVQELVVVSRVERADVDRRGD